MAMSYNKLWKLLIDKNKMKKDLREMVGLSTNVIVKMGKNGDEVEKRMSLIFVKMKEV